jgi:hypothetical protein
MFGATSKPDEFGLFLTAVFVTRQAENTIGVPRVGVQE